MLTVGVDLAAEAAGTAIATVQWSPGMAILRSLQLQADNDAILDAISTADKVGIDCPLGWPNTFVEFVKAHSTGHVPLSADAVGRDRRRVLAYRITDKVTADQVGRWPLSVAADRIAHTAMRAADLLAHLAEAGRPVDRSGTGVVTEVYPAASLHRWGLPYRGYKRKANRRQLGQLLEQLGGAAPWLHLDVHERVCRVSDHALDAVIAALTARAAALTMTIRPTPDQLRAAQTEGWIAVPVTPLSELEP